VLDSRGLLVGDNFRDDYKAELAWPAAVAARAVSAREPLSPRR
jgi:hypothetical protein